MDAGWRRMKSRVRDELRGGYFMEQVALVWAIGDEVFGEGPWKECALVRGNSETLQLSASTGTGPRKDLVPFKVLERDSLLRPTSDSMSAAL